MGRGETKEKGARREELIREGEMDCYNQNFFFFLTFLVLH